MDFRRCERKRHPFCEYRDHVSVKVSAYPDRNITGKVYHINEVVDESTENKSPIECDNPTEGLNPECMPRSSPQLLKKQS
jgi:hypothetical protein